MARRTALQRRLDALVEQFIPEIRKSFIAAIQDVTDRAILSAMITAIENGDAVAALRAVGFTEAAMRPLVATIERAFEAGGITVGASFPNVLNTSSGRTVYRFDVRNSRAEAWLRDQSSQLVTRLQNDALGAVQNVLRDGMVAGNGPRTTALDIIGRVNPVTKKREGGIIGLTSQQERWAANARRELIELDPNYLTRARRDKRFDSVLKRAIASGEPLDAAQVSKMVSRYRDGLLMYRGEVIARTEAIQALNRSEYEAISQAIDLGAASKSAVKRVWDSAGDDGRTRESHLAMDGQAVGLDEPFKTPNGDLLMFPGDTSLGAAASETIQCRCRTRHEIDWLANL